MSGHREAHSAGQQNGLPVGIEARRAKAGSIASSLRGSSPRDRLGALSLSNGQ
jgi:hypothetical protein